MLPPTSELHEKNEPQHNSRSDMCGILALEAADREETQSLSISFVQSPFLFIFLLVHSLSVWIRKKNIYRREETQRTHEKHFMFVRGGRKKNTKNIQI
jgi:hypothetical protein